MPTLFLSYAREDRKQASRVAGQLAAAGISTWRDREQLYAGQTWPKALGQAIASNDALLLLWSSRAAKSAFVELEWCTALALKKTILLCFLDQTPLPSTLAAIQGVPPAQIVASAQKFFGDETKRPEPSHIQKVVDQLSEIGAGSPEEVLDKARVAFAQSNWTVQGPVYQAGGDIHIGSPSPPPKKTKLEKWQAWVAIVAGILTAISVALALAHSYLPAPKNQTAVDTVQAVAGTISDDAGEPLAGVEVSALLDGKLATSGITGSLGQYRLSVNGPAEADVTLVARKDRYQTEKRYASLGNQSFNFKMRRKLP